MFVNNSANNVANILFQISTENVNSPNLFARHTSNPYANDNQCHYEYRQNSYNFHKIANLFHHLNIHERSFSHKLLVPSYTIRNTIKQCYRRIECSVCLAN